MNNAKKPKGLYLIETYGCQMNEYDSEVHAGILEDLNYKRANSPDESDIIVFNTCCIRENAELKVFSYLGKLKSYKIKNPNLIIALGGCMFQQKGKADLIKKRFPFVDIIFGTYNSKELSKLIADANESKKMVVDIWESNNYNEVHSQPIIRSNHIKAWVPITYGCDNFCSYCIVPYVRGREKSRKPKNILDEINNLADENYVEVTLLGQNVNSYGNDLNSNYKFSDLLRDINNTKIKRIRFMTSHPKDLSLDLIKSIKKNNNVCEHIHLPLQSGSDKILHMMNRGYTQKKFLEIVNLIYSEIPNVNITTDIIVGFPGETNDDFYETLETVKKAKFGSAFMFKYSMRKGTPAAKMSQQISEEVKKNRLESLINLQNMISKERNLEVINKKIEVLVEGHDNNDSCFLFGRTRNNKLVRFKGAQNLIGRTINVKIIDAKTWTLDALYKNCNQD